MGELAELKPARITMLVSRRKTFSTITVAIFGGLWDTGHRAQDGAIHGFADAEQAVRRVLDDGGLRIVSLDISDFMGTGLARRLADVDIVYANCGPIAALLFQMRESMRLNFHIYREVRTLGWIGYAFQEFIANRMQRADDLCLHVSRYSQALWNEFRPQEGNRLYYPVLRNARGKARIVTRSRHALRCGFFSRMSSDKGLGFVPGIMERLIHAGWPVRELVACGTLEDAALLEQCGRQLARIGVELNYLGELPYGEAMHHLARVDAVLFPSISSFEALGRIVLEAYKLGKLVIGSDYCAGHEVLCPEFRIPLRMDKPARGSGAVAFPIATLDLEKWTAPPYQANSFIDDNCVPFRYRKTDLLDLLFRRHSSVAQPARPRGAPQLIWHWQDCERWSPNLWCENVRRALAMTCHDRRDLLDLGGAFKRSLLSVGFDPEVSFIAAP